MQSAGQVTRPVFSLLPLPAFDANYIWTLSSENGDSIIVDPGDAGPVLRAAEAGLKPVAILITHHHPDHIGGIATLLERFDVPCVAPDDARIPQATQRVGDGDRFDSAIPGLSFDVLAVPGHTRSHVAYAGGGYLFCGDTLFSLGCGRLFEGTAEQMLASLDRLSTLPGETLVCCTHEYTQSNGRFAVAAEPDNPDRDARLAEVRARRLQGLPSLPSSISSELACNPFLRIDTPGLSRQIELHAGRKTHGRADAFAILRRWKDEFRG